jgi:DNA-binding transcriptional LysR family regulator
MRLRIAMDEFCRDAMHLCMHFDWNRARAFLATAEEGSFSAAAAALGVAQPTVGRQVAALEEELGVTLFERVGRSVALTAAGLDLAEHVRAMRDAALRVSLTAAGESTSLEGVVCITASELISAHLLPPVVAAIRAEHRGIEIELVASNEVRDLRRREADIAVRNVRPDDAELVARKIRDSHARLYASPDYLARVGRPTSAADLAHHEFLGFDRSELMTTGFRRIGVHLTSRNFPIVTSNHLVQLELARNGLGICVLMEEVGDRHPSLVRVLDDLAPLTIPIWLTSHRGLVTSRRIRVVFDHLAAALQA